MRMIGEKNALPNISPPSISSPNYFLQNISPTHPITRTLPKSHPCLMMFAACRQAGLPPPSLLLFHCTALHCTPELLFAIQRTRIPLTTAVTRKAPPETCKLPTDNTPTFRKLSKFIPTRPLCRDRSVLLQNHPFHISLNQPIHISFQLTPFLSFLIFV